MAGKLLQRRHFMVAAAAVAATAGLHTTKLWSKAVTHKPLDPVNPDLLFGTTSSIWGGAGVGAANAHTTEWAVKRCSELGLQGIESYADGIEAYRSDPMKLKALFDKYNMTFIDASNGEKGQSTNFIDPDQIPKTIADHVAFCRDFLQPLGCDHWKVNMGQRPAGGPSEEQLKRLADTLNEIGRQTIAMGVRLSPHPHIWGPLEREKDMRWVMELTDPKYVWMTADTGHLVLGGGDPVQIISDYFPRVAEVHLKDTYAKYRGNTSTPTQEMHKQASVYHNLGGGGVDFPAVFKVLRDSITRAGRFSTWTARGRATTASTPSAATSNVAVDDYIAHNINYLRDVLGVKLPPYST